MNESWTSIVVGVLGVISGLVASQFDFRGIVKKAEYDTKKAEIENKDDVYAGWEKLYNAQVGENQTLKQEYAEMRATVFSLQEEISKIKSEMIDFKKSTAQREEGYILQIEILENENSELKEEVLEVEILRVENAKLKEENKELKIKLKGGV